jgi:lipoprotein-anchoring transpeptidase ErfK/SrfK
VSALFLRASLVIAVLLFGFEVAQAQTTKPRTTPPRPGPAPSARTNQPPQMRPRTSPSPTKPQPMRKAADLISKQPPMVTNAAILQQITPDNSQVIVSISKQRAYLLIGDQIGIDSPISSGKRGHGTPTGSFSVLEKDKDHRSSIYGDYKDSKGRTVRGGISARIDSAPSGTRFVGAPMKWFMRLTWEGVGMHVGILPGYPASHGCIRMPEPAAAAFYSKVKVGTPVRVEP